MYPCTRGAQPDPAPTDCPTSSQAPQLGTPRRSRGLFLSRRQQWSATRGNVPNESVKFPLGLIECSIPRLVESRAQEHLDRASLIHRLVALGGVCERQLDVEDLAWIDLAGPD